MGKTWKDSKAKKDTKSNKFNGRKITSNTKKKKFKVIENDNPE
jgi:hypothetical protein